MKKYKYGSKPNPFPQLAQMFNEMLERYKRAPWYKKPFWRIVFLIILIIIAIGILTIPNMGNV